MLCWTPTETHTSNRLIILLLNIFFVTKIILKNKKIILKNIRKKNIRKIMEIFFIWIIKPLQNAESDGNESATHFDPLVDAGRVKLVEAGQDAHSLAALVVGHADGTLAGGAAWRVGAHRQQRDLGAREAARRRVAERLRQVEVQLRRSATARLGQTERDDANRSNGARRRN